MPVRLPRFLWTVCTKPSLVNRASTIDGAPSSLELCMLLLTLHNLHEVVHPNNRGSTTDGAPSSSLVVYLLWILRYLHEVVHPVPFELGAPAQRGRGQAAAASAVGGWRARPDCGVHRLARSCAASPRSFCSHSLPSLCRTHSFSSLSRTAVLQNILVLPFLSPPLDFVHIQKRAASTTQQRRLFEVERGCTGAGVAHALLPAAL